MPAKRMMLLLVVWIALGLVALFLAVLQAPQVKAADYVTRMSDDAPSTILYVRLSGGAGIYTNIQAAVNAAHDGDTIRVAQGTYLEAVVITKSITLQGGWNASFTAWSPIYLTTTINALGVGSVIRISGNVTTTIDDFVLTGGDASSYLGWGGGILADGEWGEGGLITIRNNRITDNVACRSSACQGYGGGIMIYSSRSIIENNTVISNVARMDPRSGRGGGIALWGYPMEVTLTDNSILSNTAAISPTGQYSAGEGGGLWAEGACEIVARDNLVQNNVAAIRGEAYGGGIYACGDWYENRILSNTASITGTSYGGGVYAYYVLNFDDNLVQGNRSSRSGDGSGGGIYAVYLREAARNIINNNRATRGGGVYYQKYTGQQVFSDNQVGRNWATGLGVSTQDGGGGIASKADWVEISRNEIFANNALAGGGVLVTGGDRYVLQANLLTGNNAYSGGGIYVYSATGTIIENHLDSNNAVWWGGGMYLFGKTSPRMDSNIVTHNLALGSSGFAGGGIMINIDASSRVTLTNHVIAHNTINAGNASGVHCYTGSCALIHCTIVDNQVGGSPGEGVRIGAAGGLNYLWNSIVAGHSTGVIMGGTAAASLDYNDYYDNATHVSGTGEGAHHYHLDPLFANRATGDYHLTLNSLLIDAGDIARSTLFDFEGDPRLRAPDIGVDEFIHAHMYLPIIEQNWFDSGPH